MAENSLKLPSANLLPPSGGNMNAPTTVPQRLGSSGSATGNPRNKCALKPGHSLMDWIRLGNSGADLSGTAGAVLPVGADELVKHNTRNDAWMAIRGKVYNVTRYMDFHPGGVDELMRGVGKDATKLFDEVHAWVNYEQLLRKCLVGPLRGNVVTIGDDVLKSFKETKTKNPSADGFAVPKTPTMAATNPVCVEIVPRFDWIQTRSDVTMYFYTRQFCNPGFWMQKTTGNQLLLRVLIDQTTHLYRFDLHAEVKWPPHAAKVSSESGKIQMCFHKTEAQLWPTYGTHTSDKEVLLEDIEYDYYVVESAMFNKDSFDLTLKPRTESLALLPVGYHVSISSPINGETITRSYTPVPQKFLTFQTAKNPLHLHFLIKSYESGLLSQPLRHMKEGETLQVSQAKGGFKLRHLLPHSRLVLLAAGSGITPMLSVIEHLLQRSSNRIEKLWLMFFNKTEADIWCKEALNQLQTNDDRFEFVNILSQPDGSWQGATGRVTEELLAPLNNRKAPEFASYACVCGPSAFNQAVEDILKSMHFKDENVHIFQG